MFIFPDHLAWHKCTSQPGDAIFSNGVRIAKKIMPDVETLHQRRGPMVVAAIFADKHEINKSVGSR